MPSDAPNPPYQTTRAVAEYAARLLEALTRRAAAVRVDVHDTTVEGEADHVGFYQQVEFRHGIYDIAEEDPVAHKAAVEECDLESFFDEAVVRILGPEHVEVEDPTAQIAAPEPEAEDPRQRRKRLGKKSAREIFREGFTTQM